MKAKAAYFEPMSRRKLTDAEINSHLAALPHWQLHEGAIVRELQLADFVQAFALLSQVALLSERLNHHAELWNVYNKVRIRLWTHDLQGLSALDFTMAAAIEQLV